MYSYASRAARFSRLPHDSPCCAASAPKNTAQFSGSLLLAAVLLFLIEDRVSRSRSKHEGESSASLCDRPSRIRALSQRQLPTDHDYAVPTREYQLDQSSPLPASAAADPVLEKTNAKTTPNDSKMLTGSHHIR